MRSGAAIPVRRQRGSPAGAVVARVEALRPPAGYRLRIVRAVLHSGNLRLRRQRSLPLKGFRQQKSLRGSQPLPAKPLSRWDLDFPRRGAQPSHWPASRHPKHDRQAEPRDRSRILHGRKDLDGRRRWHVSGSESYEALHSAAVGLLDRHARRAGLLWNPTRVVCGLSPLTHPKRSSAAFQKIVTPRQHWVSRWADPLLELRRRRKGSANAPKTPVRRPKKPGGFPHRSPPRAPKKPVVSPRRPKKAGKLSSRGCGAQKKPSRFPPQGRRRPTGSPNTSYMSYMSYMPSHWLSQHVLYVLCCIAHTAYIVCLYTPSWSI